MSETFPKTCCKASAHSIITLMEIFSFTIAFSGPRRLVSAFGKIYGILDTYKAQLLSTVKKITQEELEKVAKQRQSLLRDSDRVKDAIEHTELCVWSFCDEKVMSQHSEISKKIHKAFNFISLGLTLRLNLAIYFIRVLNCSREIGPHFLERYERLFELFLFFCLQQH